jgi:tetratricopeptide (TPR) repeat protein
VALTALKAAQIKNPKNLEIQRKIGRLLLQMGQWEDTEIFYQNLEKRENLLDEVYLAQAALLIRQGKTDAARELLWKAMMKAPDSIRIRFRLWQLYAQGKIGVGEAKNIEETLLGFARSQEGGFLELADGYQEIGNWKKAYAHYLELIEKGDDDDVLLSAAKVSDSLLREKKAGELQEILEDLQKRFPRNQMITSQLIDAYSQGKDYGLAVIAIDGLLKLLDPNDPTLIIKKARLLERWNKHWASQAAYGKLLDPPVDLLFREKVKTLLSKQNQVDDSFLKEMTETGKKALINGFYEETKRKMGLLHLEPNLKKNLEIVLDEFKAKALIQKKVFLEKEGKDHLWRLQFLQATPLLEELKDIDPDNEEVQQDLYRSYRSQD